MQTPSITDCYKLIFEMEMMDHIVAHSLQVCRVALFLTDRLKEKGISLNKNLVQASALLHDITKTRSLKTGENHAQTGGHILNEQGYPEVGHIIGQHVFLETYSVTDPPGEPEIVNYSDKRVLHDKIVSLKERMDYIMERYGKGPEHQERIRLLGREAGKLENKLFRWLPFSPGELGELVGHDCSASFSEYRDVCIQNSN
ncbi:MAG: HDIG domain-containing protein [Desulfobacteraceae bacterium]|nr:HDIG domain-containing protein [Desulfobacteraceae bacterium]